MKYSPKNHGNALVTISYRRSPHTRSSTRATIQAKATPANPIKLTTAAIAFGTKRGSNFARNFAAIGPDGKKPRPAEMTANTIAAIAIAYSK